MSRLIQGTLFLAMGTLCSVTALALPVIPNAWGYGMDTPAGRGGKIFRVTTLDYDGNGGLGECIEASGPRVCVFEVSGVIDLSARITVRNPKLTIAGQTAPAPGITLQRNELKIMASDVLVQHIRIRSGDDRSIDKPDQSSPLQIASRSGSLTRNVVIDHVSVSWAVDENIDITTADYVTIRNSIISEALHDSLHSKGAHSKAILLTESGDHISMMGNLLAHNWERNPRVLVQNFIFANNVVYNYVSGGLDMAIPSNGTPLRHTIAGNLFIQGPNSGDPDPMGVRTYSSSSSVRDTKIFLEGNRSLDHSTTDQWRLTSNRLSFSPAVSSPPARVSGYRALSAIDRDITDLVLDDVGAWPSDRDAVDRRTIEDTLRRRGRIINCVEPDGSQACAKNAGGWMTMPENRRPLNLPSDPNGDSDGDGYTNLEEWLHQLAAEVEGNAKRPMPPVLLSHQ